MTSITRNFFLFIYLTFLTGSCVQVAGGVNTNATANVNGNINTGGNNVVNDPEPNDSVAQAVPVSLNTPTMGTISSPTDTDYYSVSTVTDYIYSATITPPAGTNYYIQVVDASGAIVAGGLNQTSVTWNAYQGGNYYVQVYTTGSSTTSESYSLNVFQVTSPSGVVANPVFSPAAGTYYSAQNITVTTSTAGSTIRYTVDGSAPNCFNSLTYIAAINIAATTTINAIGCQNGYTTSAVSTALYTMGQMAATPIANPATGSFMTPQNVALTTATAGASIYYTTDGVTNPVCGTSTLYTASGVNVSASMTIKAIACLTGWADSSVLTASYTITGTVNMPAATPAAGSYSSSQIVTLSTTTTGASIYYTTDGINTPNCMGSGLLYGGSVSINQTTTLQAIACKAGWGDSSVSTSVYTLQPVSPLFSVAAGSYTSAQNISITSATGGSTIHYTTDGVTVPTCTTGITGATVTVPLNTTMTIKAVACMSGWSDSLVSSATYTVTGQVATPTPSIPAAAYATAQSISLTSATTGASIYYSTNGSIPVCGTSTLYTGAISVSATITLNAIACLGGWLDSTVASLVYTITGTIAAPVFSPVAGTYNSNQSVAITSITTGANIIYTTDGVTQPTCTGTGIAYGAPVTVSQNSTLMAIACKLGWTDSTVSTAAYQLQPVTPSFSVVAGTYQTAQTITISSITTGASIHYTTDGVTVPTCTTGTIGTTVTVPLNSTMTIKAVACNAGWLDSAVSSAAYTVTGTVADPAPGAGSASGTFITPINITLSTTTPGASIYYTTNNTTPVCGTSTLYTVAGVNIPSTMTVKAIGCLTNWTPSAVITLNYTITGTVANPAFSIAGGTYNSSQFVALTSTTTGANILYTTDGVTVPNCTGTGLAYGASISVTATTTIKAIACKAGWADSGVASATYTLQPATPTFSVAAGTYTTAQTVNISSATAGTSIRYTTDGVTVPTCATGTLGTSVTVPLNTTMTIKAVACITGWLDSVVANATYTVTGTVATPTFSIGTATYNTTQSITITSATPVASIYYTTNGTVPTCGTSTLYTAPVSITQTTTLQAIACKATWTDSIVASAVYTLQPLTPVFSVLSGTYTAAQTITISSGTAGTNFRYTTDGITTPTCATGTAGSSVVVPLNTTMTIKAVACLAGWADSVVANAGYTVTGTVATPTFTPAAGTYNTSTFVSLSSTTTGANMVYTTDGITNPTCTGVGFAYNAASPISVAQTTTIKAIACKATWADSLVATAVITLQPLTPTFSVAAGTYTTAQTVNLSSATAGTTIKYTTDGSVPTCATGILGTSVFVPLYTTMTIKAVACITGWADSVVASAAYTVTGTVATPTFSPVAGTFGVDQNITISTTTAAPAVICYSTNATVPTCNATPACTAGTTYTAPVLVSSIAGTTTTTNLTAIACKAQWTNSFSGASSYIIDKTPPAVVTSLTATAVGPYQINLSWPATTDDKTPQASIIYKICYDTINGGCANTFNTAAGATTASLTGLTPVTSYFVTVSAMDSFSNTSATRAATPNPVATLAIPASPTFNYIAGIYTKQLGVALSGPAGATIYYTTDGVTNPTCTPVGTQYVMPNVVQVLATTTIKAIACLSSTNYSLVSTATYTLQNPAVPAFSVAAGTYAVAQQVMITPPATAIEYITYTKDGTNPVCTSGMIVTPSGIRVDQTMTLKAIACGGGALASTVVTATYTINLAAITTTQMGGSRVGTTPLLSNTTSTFAGLPVYSDGFSRPSGPFAAFASTSDGMFIYFVEPNKYVIRKMNIASGAVTTIAGAVGAQAFVDSPVPGNARFLTPSGITTDGISLYIADMFGAHIRKMDLATGAVTTFAGGFTTGGTCGGIASTGCADGTGTLAQFGMLLGLTNDGTNLFAMDFSNHVIRQIVISTAVVTTLAGSAGTMGSANGTGTAATFTNPAFVTYSGGSLFITETTPHTIRKLNVSTKVVSAVAGLSGTFGNTNGTGTAALFNTPYGITNDGINLYVADTGNNTIRQIVMATNVVTTLAGGGAAGNQAGAGDGTGTGFNGAYFAAPFAITYINGNLFVSDTGNNSMRKIVASTGVTTTVAGASGSFSFDGAEYNARFALPSSVTTDGTNLYIAESASSIIKKVVISTGVATTLAGGSTTTTGTCGGIASATCADGTGTLARFNNPQALTTDGTNLYVADTMNHVIRQVVIASGAVTTIAGSPGSIGITTGVAGTAARFNTPQGITVAGSGAAAILYVSDTMSHTIRQINVSTQLVTTVAGGAYAAGNVNAVGTAARFNMPKGITTDGANLYLVDSFNHLIKKIPVASWSVTTLAGGTTGGGQCGIFWNATCKDGLGTLAQFFNPVGITLDGTNLYVTDTGNFNVRAIAIATGNVTTVAGSASPSGGQSDGTSAQFSNLTGVTTDGRYLYVTDGIGNIRKIY